MKKYLFLLSAAVMIIPAYGGIFRHDVPAAQYKALARQQQFDCVGIVLDSDGRQMHGSCVLIGNRYVLSAAHVLLVNDIRVDTFFLDANGKVTTRQVKGGAMALVNQPVNSRPGNAAAYTFSFGSRLYRGKQLRVNSHYLDSLNSPAGDYCGDLVIVELDDTVTAVQPATLNDRIDEQGALITGVGYGISGPADKRDDCLGRMEKIAGQNVIDKISGFEVEGRASLLGFDFDHPTQPDRNRMGAAKALPLEYNPVSGDSGGGIFRQVNGSWQLLGIVSGGPESGVDMAQVVKHADWYGSIAQCARVAVFREWILQTINELEKTRQHAVSPDLDK